MSNTSTIASRHLLGVDLYHLSLIDATNNNSTGFTMYQHRTSIINYHQRRNSQLRKSSFTISTLVCCKIELVLLLDIDIRRQRKLKEKKKVTYLRHTFLYFPKIIIIIIIIIIIMMMIT